MRTSVLTLVLMAASGCGLSEYERRMDAQRARIQQLDDARDAQHQRAQKVEETLRLLDDPIDMPMLKTGSGEIPAWPYEVFLRLPKGYTSAVKENTLFLTNFPCYRYAGGKEGAQNIFIVAATTIDPQTDKNPQESFACYYPAKFRGYLREALQSYYFKAHKIAIVLQEKERPHPKPMPVVPADSDPPAKVNFMYSLFTDEPNHEAKDHTAFDVYLHEEPGKQIYIVVQRPMQPANADQLNRSIEASLGTLDVSAEAVPKLARFRKLKVQ